MPEGLSEERVPAERAIERADIERRAEPDRDHAEGGLPGGLIARGFSHQRDPQRSPTPLLTHLEQHAAPSDGEKPAVGSPIEAVDGLGPAREPRGRGGERVRPPRRIGERLGVSHALWYYLREKAEKSRFPVTEVAGSHDESRL